MKLAVKPLVVGLSVMSLMATFSANAAAFAIGDTVTVTETSVNPTLTVSINNADLGGPWNVYAGINNLTIQPGSGGSVVAQGFCIDPFHWSASGSVADYRVVDLQNAPKPTRMGSLLSGMGTIEADQIGTLWATHFSSTMTALNAAALQVAIWDIVGHVGGGGSLIDGLTITGDSSIMNLANDWVNGITGVRNVYTSGASANLLGLTGSGQDYVIASVPDGGATVILFGVSLLALAVAGRKLRTC